MAEQQAKKRKREQDDSRPSAPRPAPAFQNKGKGKGPASPAAATPVPAAYASPAGDVKGKAKVVANDEATLRSMGKKKAFKHAMDSPFAIKWASIPDQLAAEIMQELCDFVRPWGTGKQGNRDRTKERRRLEKRAKEAAAGDKAAKDEPKSDAMDTGTKSDTAAGVSGEGVPKLYIGINGVTRNLQKAVRNGQPSDIEAVFLCRQDVSPIHLYAHFPILCQMARRKADGASADGLVSVPLIPLPKGAESQLAKVLKLKRVVVVGVTSMGNHNLAQLVPKVDVPPITWLPAPPKPSAEASPKDAESGYSPLKMKTLETTAPILNKKQQKKTTGGSGEQDTPPKEQQQKKGGKANQK